MRQIFIISFSILTLLSCKKEKETEVQLPEEGKSQVLILNEGNFRSANASIDLYYPQDHGFLQGIFSSNNNDRPLGDVAQSMSLINGEYWVVINNSNKIEILDPNTLQSKASFKGFNSPRYLLPINSRKAYVSDLYEEMLYVIDPLNRSILKKIESKGWTEEMILHNHKAFICQSDSDQVLIFDTNTDSLLKKISTYRSPHALEIDANSNVWVACSGGYNESATALQLIDPVSLSITRTLSSQDISKSIGDIAMNNSKDKLYYLMDDLFSIDIQDTTLSSTSLIASNNRNFYAMDVDPISNEIYLSDALDYQQRGVVYRYSSSGSLLHQFKAGLIPGFFYFSN